MKELNFDLGLVSYKLTGARGDCEIVFNPTDGAFLERIYNAFSALDEKKEEYEQRIEKAQAREIFDILNEREAEMRAMLDEVIGEPLCDTLFGGMSVFAMADGLPVCFNLLLSIMDEMDEGFVQQQAKTNPRIAKYTAKYKKRK